MDYKVQHIINIIAQKEKYNSLLKAALKNSDPIDTVNLTNYATTDNSATATIFLRYQ